MTQYASLPTTDKLLSEAATAAGTRHKIEAGGTVVDLFLQSDRILAYRGDEDTPIAVLRFGGRYSGAIWMEGELVGEYHKNPDGQFILIEIEAGFKLPDSLRQEDPVAHVIKLIRRA
jgi:hypothetical protein